MFLAYKNSGFKRFVLHTQLSFCVFFYAQLSGNFLKIAFFKKRVQKLGFSIFSVLSLSFENSLFLGLLKHYENRGFSNFLCFCCWKGRKQAKEMITGISGFWFFWSKMAVSWRICFFKKKVCWNPYFYSVFRVRAFRAKLSKKGNFGHPPKKKKILTDNWKAHFWVFFGFSCFFCSFFVFLCFGVFFWRV